MCRSLNIHAKIKSKGFECLYHNKLWNILKERGIPDHLTGLLRNLKAAQEAPIKRVIKTAGTYSIILADSSKLGEKAFAKVCEPFDMDFFITDNMNDDMKEKMESKGVKVIIA